MTRNNRIAAARSRAAELRRLSQEGADAANTLDRMAGEMDRAADTAERAEAGARPDIAPTAVAAITEPGNKAPLNQWSPARPGNDSNPVIAARTARRFSRTLSDAPLASELRVPEWNAAGRYLDRKEFDHVIDMTDAPPSTAMRVGYERLAQRVLLRGEAARKEGKRYAILLPPGKCHGLRLDHVHGGRGHHGAAEVAFVSSHLWGSAQGVTEVDGPNIESAGGVVLGAGYGGIPRQHSGNLTFVGIDFRSAYRRVAIYCGSKPLEDPVRFIFCAFTEDPTWEHDTDQFAQVHGANVQFYYSIFNDPKSEEHGLYPHGTPAGTGGLFGCTFLNAGGQALQLTEDAKYEDDLPASDYFVVDTLSLNGTARFDRRASFSISQCGSGDRLWIARSTFVDSVPNDTRKTDGTLADPENYGALVCFDRGGHISDAGFANELCSVNTSTFAYWDVKRTNLVDIRAVREAHLRGCVILSNNGRKVSVGGWQGTHGPEGVGRLIVENCNRPEDIAKVKDSLASHVSKAQLDQLQPCDLWVATQTPGHFERITACRGTHTLDNVGLVRQTAQVDP